MAAATSSVTQSELRTMGRDTIAGLIAGILQKYSHEKKEVHRNQTLIALSHFIFRTHGWKNMPASP